MCDGRGVDNKNQRRIAFDKVVDILGCLSKVYEYDDLSLEQQPLNKISDIIRFEIESFGAERVICPSIDDLHQDHVVISRSTRISCRGSNVKELLEFKVPGSSTSLFNISVEIKDFIEDKIEMCRYYESELKIDPCNPCSLIGIININKGDGATFGMDTVELLRLVWSKR